MSEAIPSRPEEGMRGETVHLILHPCEGIEIADDSSFIGVRILRAEAIALYGSLERLLHEDEKAGDWLSWQERIIVTAALSMVAESTEGLCAEHKAVLLRIAEKLSADPPPVVIIRPDRPIELASE